MSSQARNQLLKPDEYIRFCERLIEAAPKYGHPHHALERVLDELIDEIAFRTACAAGVR